MQFAHRPAGLLASAMSFALAGLALPGVSRAANFDWTGGSTFSNDWGFATNWFTLTVPTDDINNSVVRFTRSARSSPNLAFSQDVNRILFADDSFGAADAFTLTGSSGVVLTVGDGGILNTSDETQRVNQTIRIGQNQTWETTSRDLHFGGARTGTANLQINRSGGSISRLILMGNGGAHTGNISIASGTMRLTNTDAISTTSNVEVRSGAKLDLDDTPEDFGSLSGAGTVDFGNGSMGVGVNGLDTTFTGSFVGSNSASFAKQGSTTMTLNGDNSSYTGDYNVSAGTLFFGPSSIISDNSGVDVSAGATLHARNDENIGKLTGAGTVNIDGVSLGVGYHASGAASFAGDFIGNGTLVKGGTTLLTLTGQSNFTNGTVRVAGGNLALTAGELAVESLVTNAGGAFAFTGGRLETKSVTGNLTVSGGTFAPQKPDASTIAMPLAGNYAQSATSTLEINVSSGAALARLSATGTVTLNGELDLIRTGAILGYNVGFSIITGTSITGVFSSINGITIDANKSWAVFYSPTSVIAQIALPGDANDNGTVNFDDLLALAANYNSPTIRTWSQGDFTGNGVVNFDDLLVLAARYNTSVPGTPAGDFALAQILVPEPASLLLLTATPSLLTRRRRPQPRRGESSSRTNPAKAQPAPSVELHGDVASA